MTRFIDALNEKGGQAISWFVLPLLAVVLIDVIARRVFNSPTMWGHETAYMLYGFFWMMGAGYTLLYKGHTRIDVLLVRFPPKTRVIVELVGYAFFFAFCLAFLVIGTKFAAYSWSHLQTTGKTLWDPPIYPLKTVIPVAFLLLFLQGISETAKLVASLKREFRS